MPSFVVNFTFTSIALIPMQRASERRMSSLYGAIFGASQISVQSTCRTVQPWSSRNVQTSLRSRMLSAPFQASSSSGKCCPMSPSPAAPSSASMIACVSTSASEWPASPLSASSISTPPSTSRARPRAGASRSRSPSGRSSDRLEPALAAVEDRELADADRVSTRAPGRTRGRPAREVRVRGERDRPAGLQAHLEERRAG